VTVLLWSLLVAGSLLALTPVSGQQQTPHGLIDGPGVELVRRKCSLCHDLGHITALRQTREEWEDTVKIMIRRGAPVTSAEMAIIVEYCTRYYGK
jgi:hypothetical protein